MKIVHVTKENFEAEVLNANTKVLVDFWAPWCGPCRMLSPVLEELANEHEDFKICKINVDEEGELASMFRVMSIPTILVFDNKKVVNTAVGFRNKQDLLKLL